jgi:hypothetical protein
MDWGIPIIAAAPWLAGLTAAVIHSAATSPPKVEAQTMQSDIEGGELDEALAELRRRKEHRLKTQGKTDAERSIYLG